MDLRRILKVYNYVNDERRPKVNVKFLGLLAALLGVGTLLVFMALSNPTPAGGGQEIAAERTEYVGLTDVEAALYGADVGRTSSILESRLDAWQARHAEAEILAIENHYNEAGLRIGYDITYRE